MFARDGAKFTSTAGWKRDPLLNVARFKKWNNHEDIKEVLGNQNSSGIVRSTMEASVHIQELGKFFFVKLVDNFSLGIVVGTTARSLGLLVLVATRRKNPNSRKIKKTAEDCANNFVPFVAVTMLLHQWIHFQTCRTPFQDQTRKMQNQTFAKCGDWISRAHLLRRPVNSRPQKSGSRRC